MIYHEIINNGVKIFQYLHGKPVMQRLGDFGVATCDGRKMIRDSLMIESEQ